jgi:hypothetical protein
MVDTSTGGMKLATRGKVRGRALKHQQGVGINETDVKVSLQCIHHLSYLFIVYLIMLSVAQTV